MFSDAGSTPAASTIRLAPLAHGRPGIIAGNDFIMD